MTAWFERGDGARFEVPEGSDAYALLVAQGAHLIAGPDAPTPTASSSSGDAPAPTKKDLLARAAELGVEGVGQRTSNDAIAAAIAAKEAGGEEG